jgi:hypothetical protein
MVIEINSQINSEKSRVIQSPSILILDIEFQPEMTLSQMCQLILPLLANTRLSRIKDWEIPADSTREFGSLSARLEQLRIEENHPDAPNNARFYLEEYMWIFIGFGSRPQQHWDITLSFIVEKHHTSIDLETFVDSAVEVCRQLLRNTPILGARLQRIATYGDFIPDVPIIGAEKYLVMTTQTEVEQNYERPEVFWNASFWSSIEQYEEQYLLLREEHTFDDLDFIHAVYDQHWQLARAVKPGVMKYYYPNVRPHEEEIFFAGEPRLNIVGYSTEKQIIEYTCCVEPDEHIQGWEIYKLRELVKEGTLEDGRPINSIQVVFPNEEMAQREKRPLLNIGVKVIYLNYMSEDVEITE